MFDKLKEMGFLQNCSDPEKCDNYFTISARQSKSARRNRETNFFTEQFDKFRKVLINFIQVGVLYNSSIMILITQSHGFDVIKLNTATV